MIGRPFMIRPIEIQWSILLFGMRGRVTRRGMTPRGPQPGRGVLRDYSRGSRLPHRWPQVRAAELLLFMPCNITIQKREIDGVPSKA
jgi:hypothetical protein